MTTRRLVTVLYEDAPDGPPRNFGPHALLLACIEDRTGEDRYALRDRVEPVPKKSNGNVKRALENDAERLHAAGPVVAVLDDDRVKELYSLPPAALRCEVLAAIAKTASVSTTVVLLEANMETLVAATAAFCGDTPPSKKPTPRERDRILHKGAAAEKGVRDRILARVPTFRRLVEKVEEKLKEL